MREFLIQLFAFSGTAIAILLIAVGFFLQMILSDKNKILAWVVFAIFCIFAICCIILRNVFSVPLA